MPDDNPYDPSFDRIHNIFHALLATRSELSPEKAGEQAIAIYRSFTEALKAT